MTERFDIVPVQGTEPLTLLEQNVHQQFESLMGAMVQNAADMRELLIQVTQEVLKNKACNKQQVSEWLFETNTTYSDLMRDELVFDIEAATRVAARAAAATSRSYERLTSVVEQLEERRKAAIARAAASRVRQKSRIKRIDQLGRCQGKLADNIKYAELWMEDYDVSTTLLRSFAATIDWAKLLHEVQSTLARLAVLEGEGNTSAADLRQYIVKAEEAWTQADAIQAQVHDAVLRLQTTHLEKDDGLGQRIENLARIERFATDLLFELQSSLEQVIGSNQYSR